ncbi:helix-turn-helix domain-containing protein [Streptomyces sp. NPDC048638]|uniref:helix-turn-helix domain-containing protein n=1 Tax=Streptomyces sp. NPDC048638 TaxID=3365580 RepID=UPI003721D027
MGLTDTTGALRLLELLIADAPAWRYEELVQRASAAGTDIETVEQLVCAKRLALQIEDRVSRGRRREAELTGLVDVVRGLSRSPDPEAALNQIVRRTRMLMHSDLACIARLDEPDGDVVISAVDGAVTTQLPGLRVPVERGIGGAVVRNRGPFWVSDYLTEDRITHDPGIDHTMQAEGLRAVLSVPMWADSEQLGVLYVADRSAHEFSPDDVALLQSLADIAAVAVMSGRLLARLEGHDRHRRSGGRPTTPDEPCTALTQQRLLQRAIDGAELDEVLDHCSRELGGSLAVYDRYGEVVGTSGHMPPRQKAELARAHLDVHASGRPVALADGTWLARLTARSDPGWLLFRPDGAGGLDPAPSEILLLVANVVSMMMASRRSAPADHQWRDDLLEDLIGLDHPAEVAMARARRLQVGLDRPHNVVIARPEGPVAEQAAAWAASWVQRRRGLKMTRDDCVVLLLPGDDPAAMAHEVSAGLSAALEVPVTVGAAGPAAGPESIQRFYQEAMRCVEALVAMGGEGRAACARDLGFLGLLFAEDYDVAEFVNKIIGPVIEYDTQRFTALVETLEAYFQAACSPTRAAELLYVHPNTVSRRLERITQLLDRDWQEPDQALELQLALRLHRTRYASQVADTAALASRGRCS